jgi:hypothetical protein
MRFFVAFLGALLLLTETAQAQVDEIVANLAGGRVLIQVTRDAIVFAAIDHPLEATSVPPRVAEIDKGHVAIFFGASEWKLPAAPKPIRLDRDLERIAPTPHRYEAPGGAESDLEEIGVLFLEKLRPLAAQLHRKIDLKPEEPILELVLIGYAPKNYGPEVWLIEYRVEQNQPGSSDEYLQTHVLRPRFTQLYPPEKHEAHTLVEVRFPEDLAVTPLLGLIQQDDPRIARLRSSDPRFAKVLQEIEHGQAQKSVTQDAADLLRAVVPLIAGDAKFIQATFSEDTGFRWVVPPDEPVSKEQKAEDSNRPPDAPSLRRRPDPNQ